MRDAALLGEVWGPAPAELVEQVVEDVGEDHPPAHHVEVVAEPLGDPHERVAELGRRWFGAERPPVLESPPDLDALTIEGVGAGPGCPVGLVPPGALGDREPLEPARDPRGPGPEPGAGGRRQKPSSPSLRSGPRRRRTTSARSAAFT